MKSAEEILRGYSSVCPKFPDPTCGGGCMCNADLAAIRAAQIDAAEWMREEAAEKAETCFPRARTYASENADVYRAQDNTQALIGKLIRSIKLPGDGE